jgi:site-specific DNA-cytosine methylase
MRWSRTEKGKKARQESKKKNKKDYTPFSDGHRKLEESEEDVSGCVTNAVNKDSLIGCAIRTRAYKGEPAHIEKREDKIANQLTTVEKDSMVMKNANAVTPDAYLTKGERKRDKDGKAVLTSMNERRIRRLTPVECERLQGFPDDWTRWGIDETGETVGISDTQRYKMCGNAVTVNVIEAIGVQMLKRVKYPQKDLKAIKEKKGDNMRLHPGMKWKTCTGKTVTIVKVQGNTLYVKNRKGNYYYVKRYCKRRK